MDVLPEDLGPRRQVALLLLRSAGLQRPTTEYAVRRTGGTSPRSHRPLSAWGRFLTKGLDLESEDAAAVVAGSGGLVGGLLGGIGAGGGGGFLGPGIPLLLVGAFDGPPVMTILGGIFSLVGIAGLGAGLYLPNFLLRRWKRSPLVSSEVDRLLKFVKQDRLESAYLSAAGEVSALSNLTPDQEKDIRNALKALGEGIDRLPRETGPLTDEATLSREIDALHATDSESDPVIRESLQRRRTALEGSLKALQNAQVLTRRTQALQDELLTQVEALRIGLKSLQSGSNAARYSHFVALADTVRRVVAEADAVADARAELDAVLTSDPVPAETYNRIYEAASTQEPQTLTLRGHQ